MRGLGSGLSFLADVSQACSVFGKRGGCRGTQGRCGCYVVGVVVTVLYIRRWLYKRQVRCRTSQYDAQWVGKEWRAGSTVGRAGRDSHAGTNSVSRAWRGCYFGGPASYHYGGHELKSSAIPPNTFRSHSFRLVWSINTGIKSWSAWSIFTIPVAVFGQDVPAKHPP